jgi:hypothetical protein
MLLLERKNWGVLSFGWFPGRLNFIFRRFGTNIHNTAKVWNQKDKFISTQFIVKNVKCTTLQVLRLCTGRTAHRGSRGIALLFHGHGTRRRWGVRVMLRPLFIPRKEPVPIVQEAGWTPVPVWTGAENIAPKGFGPRTVQSVASRYTPIRYPAH